MTTCCERKKLCSRNSLKLNKEHRFFHRRCHFKIGILKYQKYWIDGPYFGTKFERGVVLPLLHRFKRFNLQETDKILGFRFLARRTDIRLPLQNFLREPIKVAETFGVLFASCSNAPKRGKKCDEFKSLDQNVLKLLFCGHTSLLQC